MATFSNKRQPPALEKMFLPYSAFQVMIYGMNWKDITITAGHLEEL